MAAGSTNSDEYSIRFNVDILAPIVKHADSEVNTCTCTFACTVIGWMYLHVRHLKKKRILFKALMWICMSTYNY